MENPQQLDATLRRLWIIWAPLAAGPWIVAGLTFVQPPPGEGTEAMRVPFLIVAAAVALTSAALSFFLPQRVRQQSLGRGTDPAVVFNTTFIVANALAEGAGLVPASLFLVTRWTPLLGLVALGTFTALAHRPSHEALRDWLEQARRTARPAPTGGTP